MKYLRNRSVPIALNILGELLVWVLTEHRGWTSPPLTEGKIAMDYAAPYYRPAHAIFPEGTSIHIVNPTSSIHTLTHHDCRKAEIDSCRFDTGPVEPGQNVIIPLPPPGRYSYYCILHPIMEGEFIVMAQQPKLSQAGNTVY
jgi:plastocyanin